MTPLGGLAADAPLAVALSGVPSRIALRTLRGRGLPVTLEPSSAASFVVELRGRLRGSRIARTGDVVLADRRLPRDAARRSFRLRVPFRQRSRLRRRARLALRVTATDGLGRTTVHTRRLRIR